MSRISATGDAGSSLFFPDDPPTPEKRNMKPEPNSNDEDDGESMPIDGDDSDDGELISNFNIQESLPTPTTTRRRLSYLLDLMDQNLIDLNPDYQREVVWTQERQYGLVNSIIENFYIPPVIFNIESRPIRQGVKRSDSSELVRVCVDGKQRLSSIHKFVRGEIWCTDTDQRKWWWTPGGSTRKVLDQVFKDAFLNKVFICVEYEDLTMDQQEELFGRVQKGMVLTEAEKLKARKGAWQAFALDVEEDFRDVADLSQNKRGTGFRNILSVMAQITELETIDTRMDRRSANTPALQSTAPALRRFCESFADKCTTQSMNTIIWVFRLWDKIRRTSPEIFSADDLNHAKRFAPVEFLAVGTLLWRYGHHRSIFMLRGDIKALRIWIRDKNLDLRSNSKVWRDCWAFIEHLESHRGESGDYRDHDIPPAFDDGGRVHVPSPAEKKSNPAPIKAITNRARNDPPGFAHNTPVSRQKAPPNALSSPTMSKKAGSQPEAPVTQTRSVLRSTSASTIIGSTTALHKATVPSGTARTASTLASKGSSSAAAGRNTTLQSSSSRAIRDKPVVLPTHSSRPIKANTTKSSSSSSDDDDNDDASPEPRGLRAPVAPMGKGSDFDPGKRKRVPVETTPGASSLLSKRQRSITQGNGSRH